MAREMNAVDVLAMYCASREGLRDWYVKNYPDDELGGEIDSDKNFEDLFDALDNYQDVYDCIGVGDSIIRERLFSRLAKIMGCGYEVVYEQWLRGH